MRVMWYPAVLLPHVVVLRCNRLIVSLYGITCWSSYSNYRPKYIPVEIGNILNELYTVAYVTRRMAIANGTCASFCNQPKAYFGLLWVRLWDNRGKFAWMKRGFNAWQTHISMYPSIFNRFPVIQPVSSKVRHFSTFFAHFGLPWVRPGTIAVNFSLHG